MTCIVAMTDGETVHMAADSVASDWNTLYHRSQGKVFRVGELLIGMAGSPRAADLIRYKLELPFRDPRSGPDDDHRYLVTDVASAVKNLIWKSGAEDEDQDTLMAAVGLIGYRGRLYDMHGDYQVGQNRMPYGAVGSGGHVALGVLYALHTSSPSPALSEPRSALEIALAAAEEFTPYVRKPWTYVTTGDAGDGAGVSDG